MKTGRIFDRVTGIRARPGDAMTVAGPAVITPGGLIMMGRKAGLVATMDTLGAALRDGVRSTYWPPGPPGPIGMPAGVDTGGAGCAPAENAGLMCCIGCC